MNGDLFITLILFIVSGLPFFACGYLVAIKKRTSIIAGWDENSISDPDGYARIFGWSAILCGVFLAGSAYTFSANAISVYLFIGTIMMAVIVQLLVAGYCSKRYGT